MAFLTLKQNDTPTLEDTLTDTSGRTVDLSNASEVRLFLVHVPTDSLVVNQPASIDDATAGKVSYELSASETALKGEHRAEWRVQESSGTVLRYPPGGFLKVDINEALGTLQDSEVDEPSLSLSSLSVDSLDAGSLTSNLDANAQNITNIGQLGATNADLGALVSNLDAGSNDITNIAQLGATNANLGSLTSNLDAGSNDITNVGSLSTERSEIKLDDFDGSNEDILQFDLANSNNVSDKIQKTSSVGTSATVITTETNEDSVMSLVLVNGQDTSSNRFFDIVQYGRVTNPGVVSTAEAGNPPSRSYSLAFPGLELALGSDSATVVARSFEVSL